MNNLVQQILKFLGVSGIGWLLDFTTYTLFSLFGISLFYCNILGAIVGLSFVFVCSTRFIFNNGTKVPVYVKYIIYVLYQIVLVYCISKLLVAINGFILEHLNFLFVKQFSAVMSKIIVTPITMVINFIALKNVIEKL